MNIDLSLIKKELTKSPSPLKDIEDLILQIDNYFLNGGKDLLSSIYSEIEELRLSITSERYESGSYYTPPEAVIEIFDKINPALTETICDPACGTGNFFIPYLSNLAPNLTFQEFNSYLKKYIFGFDINQNAIDIAKKRINILSLQNYGQALLDDSLDNIKVMDFLLDSNCKFDIIIGNPPYLGGKSIPSIYKDKLRQKFGFVDDLYTLFIIKSLKSFNKFTKLGFITSNTWLTLTSKKNIRELLIKNGLFFVSNNKKDLFKIKTRTSTFICDNTLNKTSLTYVDKEKNITEQINTATLSGDYNFLKTPSLFDTYSSDIHTISKLLKFSTTEEYKKVLNNNNLVPLGLLCEVGTGIDLKGNNKSFFFSINNKKYNLINDSSLIHKVTDISQITEGLNEDKYIEAFKGDETIYLPWSKDKVGFLKSIKAPLRNLNSYGKTMIYCNSNKLDFYKIEPFCLCINTAGSCFIKPLPIFKDYTQTLDILLKYLVDKKYIKDMESINNSLSFTPNSIKQIPIPKEIFYKLLKNDYTKK